jgi:hypothetical protein
VVFQTQGPNFVMVIAAIRRTGIVQEQRSVWYSLYNNILAHTVSWVRNRKYSRPQPALFKSLLTSFFLSFFLCGPGSVVGIATDHGLDVPGIESRWWRDFTLLSRPALGPTQSPVQWVPGLSGV